jgi:hypothetical protein
MKRVLLFVFCMFSLSNAWLNENYTGYGDTSQIANFKADSIKYTKVFNYSGYYNIRADILVNDTGTAKFGADSIALIWGIQTGHPILDSAKARDTAWSKELYICDTLVRSSATYRDTMILIALDGTYENKRNVADTSSVKGFIKQSKAPSIEWDVLYRGFAKGLTGNRIGKPLLLRFSFTRKEKL